MEGKSNPQIINIEYLDRMCDGDLDFKKDLIQTFLDNSPKMIDEMKACITESSWKKIGDIAHSLKPSLTLMGMEPEKEMALKIEQYGRQNMNTSEISSLINELEIKLDIAYKELKAEIDKL